MDKIKLIIIDSDMEFSNRAKRILQGSEDIDIVACIADGFTGLETIKKLHPDAVIFDLVLPGLDGISLLREITASKHAPMCVCCTQFYSSVALEAARNHGASYFLFKPIDFRTLHDTIKCCCGAYRQLQQARTIAIEDKRSSSLEIRNYLVSMGIPSKLIGCSYLSEALRLAMTDLSLTQNLSKGLYLEIARIMDTTPSCVERSIRNAISSAYQNGRLGEQMMTCPSNKEFINFALRNFNS